MSSQRIEFDLFTDGSGYKDGYSGWCCVVKTKDKRNTGMRLGAVAGSTVDRMELTAILEGLQMIWEHIQDWKHVAGLEFGEKDILVHLFTDRENLALSIQGVYDRTNAPDLWARFSWYQARMQVRAQHVCRETVAPEFVSADLHASTMRLVVKNYCENTETKTPMYVGIGGQHDPKDRS